MRKNIFISWLNSIIGKDGNIEYSMLQPLPMPILIAGSNMSPLDKNYSVEFLYKFLPLANN